MQGRTLTVQVRDSNSILEVKAKVALQHHIPAVDQRYLFGGRVLDDQRTLGALKVSSHTLYASARPHSLTWLTLYLFYFTDSSGSDFGT